MQKASSQMNKFQPAFYHLLLSWNRKRAKETQDWGFVQTTLDSQVMCPLEAQQSEKDGHNSFGVSVVL